MRVQPLAQDLLDLSLKANAHSIFLKDLTKET